MPRFTQLQIFVATTPDQVPCTRFISVDGSVPGAAITWDHHVTGEAINLDAMPEVFDTGGYEGVGTTMADTDAAASVLAVLAGGKGRLDASVRRVLEAASHRCDHLAPHPSSDPETDRLGHGLHAWVSARLAADESFGSVCRTLASATPLPWLDPTVPDLARLEEGRLDRAGSVALADLRGRKALAPGQLYALHGCPLMLIVEDHPKGGVRYTVGVHPGVPHPEDLGPALRVLAAAEHAHGPPCMAPDPGPGTENWGGRRTVFGSPWNYGSRLDPREVRALVARALGLQG